MWVARSEGAERLVDGGRVMREVVVHAHPARFAEEILPSSDALERRKVRARLGHARSESLSACRQSRHGVSHVVRARHAHREPSARRPSDVKVEPLRPIRRERRRSPEPRRRDVARVVPLERVPRDACARLGAHDVSRSGVVSVAHDEPARGNSADERAERGLVRCDVGIDVDVVVLDARDDRDVVRRNADIVEKLRLLVPVRSVVLVSFDHERSPPAIGAHPRGSDGRTAGKSLGDAADEPAGFEPRLHEKPRTHRARRRLAVGARDDEGAPPLEEALAQRTGHRDARKTEALCRLGLGVAPAYRVSDDHEIRRPLQMRGVVAAHAADTERLECRPDGRIERGVRAADVVARGAQQCRERTHPGARDADEVHAHAARLALGEREFVRRDVHLHGAARWVAAAQDLLCERVLNLLQDGSLQGARPEQAARNRARRACPSPCPRARPGARDRP